MAEKPRMLSLYWLQWVTLSSISSAHQQVYTSSLIKCLTGKRTQQTPRAGTRQASNNLAVSHGRSTAFTNAFTNDCCMRLFRHPSVCSGRLDMQGSGRLHTCMHTGLQHMSSSNILAMSFCCRVVHLMMLLSKSYCAVAWLMLWLVVVHLRFVCSTLTGVDGVT